MITRIETLPDWMEHLGQTLSPMVLWQANRIYHNNLRQYSASTKTRGMVSATGKKPYRQKKTGRARRGTMVAPLHCGGGVAHGPLPVKLRLKLNQKVSQAALLLAIYEKFKEQRLFLWNGESISGKTREAALLLKEAKIHEETICCALRPEEEVARRAFRNLQFVETVLSSMLISWDVTRRDSLLLSSEAWEFILKERFAHLRGAE